MYWIPLGALRPEPGNRYLRPGGKLPEEGGLSGPGGRDEKYEPVLPWVLKSTEEPLSLQA